VNSRGKIPTRRLTHWDIGTQNIGTRDIGTRDIGVLEVENVGAFQVPKQRNDLDRPFVQTRGGNREPVGISATGVLS
jgi:hypothetical protein